MARLTALWCLVIGVGFASGFAACATAQTSDDDRGVRILDQPSTDVPDQPKATPPMGMDLDVRKTPIKAENLAGLALDIVPGQELKLGARVTIRVATKKPGYLILVDVDATGKITQIFPNRFAVMKLASQETLNLIKPGRPMMIPDSKNAISGFEFVASPPAGVAMLVAILSDRPVQMIDLPDLPPPMEGQAAFDRLYEVARNLKIPSQDDSGTLQDPKWSFDAKLYIIK